MRNAIDCFNVQPAIRSCERAASIIAFAVQTDQLEGFDLTLRKYALLGAVSALVLPATVPGLAQDGSNTSNGGNAQPAETAPASAENGASTAADQAQDAAQSTGEAVGSAVDEAADATGEAAQEVMEAADQAAQEAADTVASEIDPSAEQAGEPINAVMTGDSFEGYLASDVMGATVMNASGESIGDVNDLIMGTDNALAGVVVGVGGFLGIGEKGVGLAMSALERSTTQDGEVSFTVDASAADLKAAPQFTLTPGQDGSSSAN